MLSIFFLPRRACAAALLCLGLAAAAQGQPASASNTPTLRQALDAAWALSPQARAAANRLAELQARERAANALISGAPSATLAHRTDRLNTRAGLREYEAELALPLWNPGVRSATQRQVAAERAALEQHQALARLKLAGEVRELTANVALAHVERTLAARKHEDAVKLAEDTDRRVKAGDTARVDALQARAVAQQAQSALAQADIALLRAQGQWQVLTGFLVAPLLNEPLATAAELHPAVQAAQAQVQSAQAKLALADADRRDPMELGVGLIRERTAYGAPGETSLRVSVRIPFGGENRNAPRLAAARAELDSAQAEADAVARQAQTDSATATAALHTARQNEALAAERANLSAQVQALIVKSFDLGEGDLPTRLRIDNEKFDADLSLARARIERQRAISQLNQALGTLP